MDERTEKFQALVDAYHALALEIGWDETAAGPMDALGDAIDAAEVALLGTDD